MARNPPPARSQYGDTGRGFGGSRHQDTLPAAGVPSGSTRRGGGMAATSAHPHSSTMAGGGAPAQSRQGGHFGGGAPAVSRVASATSPPWGGAQSSSHEAQGVPEQPMLGRSISADSADPTLIKWDAAKFLEQLRNVRAAGDDKQLRYLLANVAKSNYKLIQDIFRQDVPRTDKYSAEQLQSRSPQVRLERTPPRYTISAMTTGDALLAYAKQLRPRGAVVCALNFANGEHVGGGYLRGARAQEEELCRQFPCLYSSLNRAKDHGNAYPYGPPTYKGGRDPQGYADVLFTPKLVGRRENQDRGYAIISDAEVLDNMALVSAAAPNIKQREIFEETFVKSAMYSILLAPKMRDKRIDTIILGAWGCGAFGCDPNVMAKMFAEVLVQGDMGRLYKEVHFAIPDMGDGNLQIFEDVLRKERIPLERLREG